MICIAFYQMTEWLLLLPCYMFFCLLLCLDITWIRLTDVQCALRKCSSFTFSCFMFSNKIWSMLALPFFFFLTLRFYTIIRACLVHHKNLNLFPCFTYHLTILIILHVIDKKRTNEKKNIYHTHASPKYSKEADFSFSLRMFLHILIKNSVYLMKLFQYHLSIKLITMTKIQL